MIMYLSPMQKLAADSSFLIDEIFKQQETLLDPSLADKPEVKEIIELEIRTKVCYLNNSFELYDFGLRNMKILKFSQVRTKIYKKLGSHWTLILHAIEEQKFHQGSHVSWMIL